MANSAFRASGGGSGGSGTASGDSLKLTITQANSFTVGNVIRYNGTAYVTAQGNSASNAEVIGIVESANGSSFTFVGYGKVILSGLTPGGIYFLSTTVSGGTTLTEPTTVGYVVKPVMYAISSTVGYVQNYRGMVRPAPVSSPSNLTYVYTISTADGSAQAFDATFDSPNAEGVSVYLDAIIQRPYIDYTFSANTVTFNQTPLIGEEVEIRGIL